MANVWKCHKCNKMFHTELGRDHHVRDVHGTVDCHECNKSFSTKEALNQRIHAKHGSVDCLLCNKGFKSKEALEQHMADKHGGGSRPHRHHSHDSPHPGIQGYWVRREDFDGSKSFGRFQCIKCKKQWGSAHAYKMYKQGCQRCELRSLPCCLWVNTRESRHYSDDEDDDGPHDSRRCEACRLGVCKFSCY